VGKRHDPASTRLCTGNLSMTINSDINGCRIRSGIVCSTQAMSGYDPVCAGTRLDFHAKLRQFSISSISAMGMAIVPSPVFVHMSHSRSSSGLLSYSTTVISKIINNNKTGTSIPAVNFIVVSVPYNANEPASANSADSAGWQTMLPRTLPRSTSIR
jgi:hypothetical protein